ncbi:MAG: hypothetical protein NTW50_04185 [Candidatus Berkelbacteria bacterium]|nr:hypothetical protein [Candidatus Berkelbacteria bacterium]
MIKRLNYKIFRIRVWVWITLLLFVAIISWILVSNLSGVKIGGYYDCITYYKVEPTDPPRCVTPKGQIYIKPPDIQAEPAVNGSTVTP